MTLASPEIDCRHDHIALCMQALQDLKSLNFSAMHLTAATCHSLQATLSQMPQLKSLGLGDCHLNETTLGILLPGIVSLKGLQQLALHENGLCLEGALLLGNHFSKMKALKKLDIRNIGLQMCVDRVAFDRHVGNYTGKPFMSVNFFPLLMDLVALQELDIRFNINSMQVCYLDWIFLRNCNCVCKQIPAIFL